MLKNPALRHSTYCVSIWTIDGDGAVIACAIAVPTLVLTNARHSCFDVNAMAVPCTSSLSSLPTAEATSSPSRVSVAVTITRDATIAFHVDSF